MFYGDINLWIYSFIDLVVLIVFQELPTKKNILLVRAHVGASLSETNNSINYFLKAPKQKNIQNRRTVLLLIPPNLEIMNLKP